MDEKIKVEVCVGTTCFVMGAGQLQELEDFLPEDIRDRVEVSGTTCLGMCKKDNYGKAPFVRINDEIMPQATINSIICRLKELLK